MLYAVVHRWLRLNVRSRERALAIAPVPSGSSGSTANLAGAVSACTTRSYVPRPTWGSALSGQGGSRLQRGRDESRGQGGSTFEDGEAQQVDLISGPEGVDAQYFVLSSPTRSGAGWRLSQPGGSSPIDPCGHPTEALSAET